MVSREEEAGRGKKRAEFPLAPSASCLLPWLVTVIGGGKKKKKRACACPRCVCRSTRRPGPVVLCSSSSSSNGNGDAKNLARASETTRREMMGVLGVQSLIAAVAAQAVRSALLSPSLPPSFVYGRDVIVACCSCLDRLSPTTPLPFWALVRESPARSNTPSPRPSS